MNLTYKTNNYCLQSLKFFGVTSTEIIYSIVFVYIVYKNKNNGI